MNSFSFIYCTCPLSTNKSRTRHRYCFWRLPSYNVRHASAWHVWCLYHPLGLQIRSRGFELHLTADELLKIPCSVSTAHSGTWSSKYLQSLSCSSPWVSPPFWHPCLAAQHELVQDEGPADFYEVIISQPDLKPNRWSLTFYPWINTWGIKISSEYSLNLINTKSSICNQIRHGSFNTEVITYCLHNNAEGRYGRRPASPSCWCLRSLSGSLVGGLYRRGLLCH